MTLDETPAELDALWEDWERRGEDLKDPYYSVERLEGMFRAASGERRAEMEQVFCEWVFSDDEAQRMTARGFLRRYAIQRGVEPLRARARQLADDEDLMARFERQQALDVALQIEVAAGGYEQLVEDPARLGQTVRLVIDRVEAEAGLPDGRSRTGASAAQLLAVARRLAAWQAERDPAQLDGLADDVAAAWPADLALAQLILAICAAGQPSSG